LTRWLAGVYCSAMIDSPLPPPNTGLGDANAQLQADFRNRYEALQLMLIMTEEALNQLDDVAEAGGNRTLLPIAHKLRDLHHQIAKHAAGWHALDLAVLQQYPEIPSR
jgi:hypothetical protein